MFPTSPHSFDNDFVKVPFDEARGSYFMTNAGLNMEAELFQSDKDGSVLIILNVALKDNPKRPIAFRLKRVKKGVNIFRIIRHYKDYSTLSQSENEIDYRHHRSIGRHHILIYDEHPIFAHDPFSRSASGAFRSASVVHFEYPKEIYIRGVFNYKIKGCNKEALPALVPQKDLTELICDLQHDEIQIEPPHGVIVRVELQAQGRKSNFGITLKRTGQSLEYGIWTWNSVAGPADLNEMRKYLIDSTASPPSDTVAFEPLKRRLSIELRPRPRQPHHFHSRKPFHPPSSNDFGEFSMKIAVAFYDAVQEAQEAKNRLPGMWIPFSLPVSPPPYVQPGPAKPPKFSNHGEKK